MDIAAALAQIAQGSVPLLVSEQKMQPEKRSDRKSERKPDRQRPERQSPGREARVERKGRSDDRTRPLSTRPRALKDFPDVEMCRYRVEVGHDDDVKPGNLVGAIANEAEIESCYIGAIDIFDDFSTVDLPAGMPAETFRILKNARVCGKKINISELKSTDSGNSKQKSAAKKKSAKSKPSSTGQKRKSSAKKSAKLARKWGYSHLICATTKFSDEESILTAAGVDAVFNIYAEAGVGLAQNIQQMCNVRDN